MHPLYYYLALIVFLCYCQAAPLDDPKQVDEPSFASNTTLRTAGGPVYCNKYGSMSEQDKSNVLNALNAHYKRGQWGINCYGNGWCVDARNLLSWNSPQDCMNELRGKLVRCINDDARDGYAEQTVFAAECMMHYWLNGI